LHAVTKIKPAGLHKKIIFRKKKLHDSKKKSIFATNKFFTLTLISSNTHDTGLSLQAAGSSPQATDSNPQITDSSPHVPGSSPQVSDSSPQDTASSP
jgi:hypothetical protein